MEVATKRNKRKETTTKSSSSSSKKEKKQKVIRNPIYDVNTQEVLDILKKGIVPWTQVEKYPDSPSINWFTGTVYRGKNANNLGIFMDERRFSVPIYITFKQVQKINSEPSKKLYKQINEEEEDSMSLMELKQIQDIKDTKWSVKKGAKSATVYYWFDKNERDAERTEEEEEDARNEGTMDRIAQQDRRDSENKQKNIKSSVFNIAEVVGAEHIIKAYVEERSKYQWEKKDVAEIIIDSIVKSQKIKVTYDDAFTECVKTNDQNAPIEINMKRKQSYKTADEYYSTFFRMISFYMCRSYIMTWRKKLNESGIVLATDLATSHINNILSINSYGLSNKADYWLKQIEREPKLYTIATTLGMKVFNTMCDTYDRKYRMKQKLTFLCSIKTLYVCRTPDNCQCFTDASMRHGDISNAYPLTLAGFLPPADIFHVIFHWCFKTLLFLPSDYHAGKKTKGLTPKQKRLLRHLELA